MVGRISIKYTQELEVESASHPEMETYRRGRDKSLPLKSQGSGGTGHTAIAVGLWGGTPLDPPGAGVPRPGGNLEWDGLPDAVEALHTPNQTN